MNPFIFFVLLLVFFLAVKFFTRKPRAVSAPRPRRTIASRLDPSSLKPRRIDGPLPAANVSVDVRIRGAGASAAPWTQYTARHLRSLGLGFYARARSRPGASGQGKRRPRDILVGDPAFDDRVLVRGQDPDRIARFLTVVRRRAILEALDSFPGLIIDEGRVFFEEPGRQEDPERIASTVRRLSQLSLCLSGARREEDLRVAPVAELAGEVEEMPPAPASALEVPPMETATESVAPPAEPAIPTPESKFGLPAPLAEVVPPSPELEAAEVCQALFDEGVSAVDGSRAFEERYRDRRIRWTGVLRAADEYSFDFVFEGGPGTKASLEVHEMPGTFGASKVHGVVQLPPGRSDALLPRVGAPFTLEGRLRSADRLMRRVFVADGRLTGADGLPV